MTVTVNNVVGAPRRRPLPCPQLSREAIDLRESGCDPFDPLYDCRFGLYADNAVQLSPAFKQQ